MVLFLGYVIDILVFVYPHLDFVFVVFQSSVHTKKTLYCLNMKIMNFSMEEG